MLIRVLSTIFKDCLKNKNNKYSFKSLNQLSKFDRIVILGGIENANISLGKLKHVFSLNEKSTIAVLRDFQKPMRQRFL